MYNHTQWKWGGGWRVWISCRWRIEVIWACVWVVERDQGGPEGAKLSGKSSEKGLDRWEVEQKVPS